MTTTEEILDILVTELERDKEHYHNMSEYEKCLGIDKCAIYHEGKSEYANDILNLINELKEKRNEKTA